MSAWQALALILLAGCPVGTLRLLTVRRRHRHPIPPATPVQAQTEAYGPPGVHPDVYPLPGPWVGKPRQEPPA